MKTAVKERRINVGGLSTRYLKAGNDGLPLVLLHGDSDSSIDWSWVLPELAATHRVYAPDFPGFGDSAKPNVIYSVDFLAQFVVDFITALEIDRAVLVGNSLGGLVALRLALSRPEQVPGLVLVDSSGLGYSVTPLLSQLTVPLYGELATTWCRTPLGAKQRSWGRAALFFANPMKAPAAWLEDQERMALLPGYMEATLSSLRAQLNVIGQREVLLDSLPQLNMPTLVVWGADDKIFPKEQAQAAVSRLKQGHLALIPQLRSSTPSRAPRTFYCCFERVSYKSYCLSYSLFLGGIVATQRWDDRRLDRLAELVEANRIDIAANSRDIAALKESIAQLVSVAQIQQQTITETTEALIQEIRGLRAENRRILSHLFGEQQSE